MSHPEGPDADIITTSLASDEDFVHIEVSAAAEKAAELLAEMKITTSPAKHIPDHTVVFVVIDVEAGQLDALIFLETLRVLCCSHCIITMAPVYDKADENRARRAS